MVWPFNDPVAICSLVLLLTGLLSYRPTKRTPPTSEGEK